MVFLPEGNDSKCGENAEDEEHRCGGEEGR